MAAARYVLYVPMCFHHYFINHSPCPLRLRRCSKHMRDIGNIGSAVAACYVLYVPMCFHHYFMNQSSCPLRLRRCSKHMRDIGNIGFMVAACYVPLFAYVFHKTQPYVSMCFSLPPVSPFKAPLPESREYFQVKVMAFPVFP